MDQYADMSGGMDQYAGVPVGMDQYAGVSVGMDQYAGVSVNIDQYADVPVNMDIDQCSQSTTEMYRGRNMQTRDEALEYGLSFPDTYKEAPFHDANWQLVRVKGSKKAFLWTYERDGYVNLNVKVSPEWRDLWRSAYESVIAGYHQNKEHWNTIILDGTIPDDDIKRMIADSYDLIADSPTKRIYEAVKKIPSGKVATYGLIAELAGDRKMARAVGNALHKNPDPDNIPCFRVVNSKGELAGGFAFGGAEVQARLLEEDGVEVVDGKVDLGKYLYRCDGE